MVLDRYRTELNSRFVSIISDGQDIAPRMFDEVIRDALTLEVSDIHFEPKKETVGIRFRVDGFMRHVGDLPLPYYQNVLY